MLPLLDLALRACGGALLLAWTAFALGRRLLARLDLGRPSERAALRASAGLAALGLALTVLALLGWLTPVAVALVAVAAHAAGWSARPCAGPATDPPDSPPRAWTVAAVAVALLPALVLPLYPPLHHDAGMYHLPFVRSLATCHRLAFMPEVRFAAFPQLGEILSVPGYWLAGAAGAQATHGLFGALTALLLLAWGRRVLPAGLRLWPAASWIGNPLVVFLLGAAYVDLTLTAFVTAGALAWTRWHEDRRPGWLVLSGVLLGSATAVKYLGLVPLAGFAAATLIVARPRRRAPLAFAGAAVLAAAPMLGWIAATTGNPVFPFVPAVFGRTPWSWTAHVRGPAAETSAAEELTYAVRQVAAGLGKHLTAPFTLPYRVLVTGAGLDAESLVSLAFLVSLGLGAAAARRHRALVAVELVVAGHALVWSSLMWPDARFTLPVAPMAAILAVAGLDRLRGGRGRRLQRLDAPAVLSGIAAAIALPGIAYAWSLVAAGGAPPTAAADRMAWLGERRGEIAAVDLLNRTFPDGYRVYGLRAENSRYFARGEQLGDWVGLHPYDLVIPLLDDPPALHRELCALGASHFLVVTRAAPFAAPSHPGFAALFREMLRRPDAVLYEIVACPPRAGGGGEGSPP